MNEGTALVIECSAGTNSETVIAHYNAVEVLARRTNDERIWRITHHVIDKGRWGHADGVDHPDIEVIAEAESRVSQIYQCLLAVEARGLHVVRGRKSVGR